MYPLGDRVVDLPHPDVFVLPGGGVQLVHLRGGGVADQKHAPLLVGNVPYDEPVEGEHCRLVLQPRQPGREREREREGREGDEPRDKE